VNISNVGAVKHGRNAASTRAERAR
jgi:hypothetical protein